MYYSIQEHHCENNELKEQVIYLEANFPYLYSKRIMVETLDGPHAPKLKPSIEKPPILELKTLPSYLKYAFLEKDSKLLLVISSSLTNVQEEKLTRVLREHNKSLGSTIADIKGISSSICTHKILMEEECKPKVQPQRRLNPSMKVVVKAEVIKLLDAGMICPIFDSPWVSPVQVVSKK